MKYPRLPYHKKYITGDSQFFTSEYTDEDYYVFMTYYATCMDRRISWISSLIVQNLFKHVGRDMAELRKKYE